MTGLPRVPRRVTVLSNPAAGVGHAGPAADRAVARLRALGAEVRPRAGRDAADATRLAREAVAEGVDAVAVVGGDGMINLALQALAGTGVPLGVIPAGTGNDQAREYGLPLGDPEAAADVVAAGRTRTVDLGRITGPDGAVRYFGSVLATGFDSLVSDRANRLRWPRGRMRYNLAILAEFANLRALPFRVTLDDGTVVDRALTLAAIGNTRSYGGGMLMCPTALPDDGLLDVTLVDAMPRARIARFFPTVFKGTHTSYPEVTTLRTRSLRIESPGITAYADGEFIAPLPVDVAVEPAALTILVP
ncbi:diacylglycerol kinase [Streptomyces rubellomurinus]|uniref:Diacylglycerol kinase n=1 Tax=Streptomyces rubellomurinus (strain ATCC 31215) TaxID=359131 RepID=A0A0F2T666_STRR3|nr:diacylglycerol kinase [Streptomyces rubellomurinus]KJS58693.1 diacylglycerol kinase [Streptomyces rubellomurinus]